MKTNQKNILGYFLAFSLLVSSGCVLKPEEKEISVKVETGVVTVSDVIVEKTGSVVTEEEDLIDTILIPKTLVEKEKIEVGDFVKNILKLEIDENEYQERFKEDEENIWEIYKVGSVEIPNKGEKDSYAIRYVYNYPSEQENGEVIYVPDSFEFYLAYIEDGLIHYFGNASYIAYNNNQQKKFFGKVKIIEKYTLGSLSDEFAELELPDSPHSIKLEGNMFSCSDVLLEALVDSSVLSPYFEIDENLSVWKVEGNNYYYLVKDKLNTCSVYKIWYEFYLENNDLRTVGLNLNTEKIDISNKKYTSYTNYKPHPYTKLPVLTQYDLFFQSEDNIFMEYLENIGSTSSGEKVYVLSKNTLLLCDEFWTSVAFDCKNYVFDMKEKNIIDAISLAFLNYISKQVEELDSSNYITVTLNYIKDKVALVNFWQDYLEFQSEQYPNLFIEDSFGGLILFVDKDYSNYFWY